MISYMRPGSVILDMAASINGGNCAQSVVNQVIETENKVKIIGITLLIIIFI